MYTPEMIRESRYEGWVAWIDGTPLLNPATGGLLDWPGAQALFEEVPHNPLLKSTIAGATDREPQFGGRNEVDWKDLPHERTCILELYAFRHRFPKQPIAQFVRNVDQDVRWIQMKRGAVVVNAAAITKERNEDRFGAKQERTGISSWVLGYWSSWMNNGTLVGQCEMVEYFESGKLQRYEFSGSNHPCWPKPLGMGFAPHVLGLTEADVPEVPEEFRLAGAVPV